MKKLLLSASAIFALAFSASAQNPSAYSEDYDSTAAEPTPCYIGFADGFTFPYNPGSEIISAGWASAETAMELTVTSDVTEPIAHGPMYYKLSNGTEAACSPGVGIGQVDISGNSKFQIRMKATAPMQILVYVQEGNDPSWNYSKFSNSYVRADLTSEYQVFNLDVSGANVDSSGTIDLTSIGGIAFELGKTDGESYDQVSDVKVHVDYIRFGDATVGVQNVSSSSSINVFPNPATDVLNVAVGAGNANVQLSSVTGAVVASANGSGNLVLNTANVQAGLYVVTVNNAAGTTTSKVVIK
jgi:hypothetical protein